MGSGSGTFQLRRVRPGRSSRSTSAAARAGAKWCRSRSTSERSDVAASESYPENLLYNAEHDWGCIEGDEAVLGITWYAADSLGELVHFEPPEPGATIVKGSSYGEVESVKAVSDLVSPLSGEVLEVNEKVTAAPETVN